MKRSVIIVALALAELFNSGCNSPKPSPEKAQDQFIKIPSATINIKLHSYFSDLKTIDVSIQGKSHKFLLDTGGGISIITPALAKSLGQTPFGRITGHRMDGELVVMQKCDRLDVVVGDSWSVHLSPVAVFDLDKLLPKELPHLDGVISLDCFRGQVLTLNIEANQLLLHSKEDAESAIQTNGITARFATGDDGSGLTLITPVEGKRGKLWFLLDSGNCAGTFVSTFALQEHLIDINDKGLVELSVGGRDPIAIPVIPQQINYDGVIGTNFLKARPVTLDLRKAP